mgnify:CR=1 FL=1
MNKKERVMAVIRGEKPDRIPTGFWFHFSPRDQERVVSAHLRYFAESGTDICKVMNEALLRGESEIRTPGDYARAALSGAARRNMERHLDDVKRICDETGNTSLVQATLHGVVVSTHHLSLRKGLYVDNRMFFRTCMTENREALINAFDMVTDVLCELSERFFDAGVGGIYYACLGGERDLFTPEEYNTYIKPFEMRVLQAAGKTSCVNTLHICKSGLDISRYQDLPAQVVNWAIHENNPSLEEGAEIFKDKVILGGLDDRSGVLVDGTNGEIESEVHAILRKMAGRRFILGSDCTLPTDISCSRIQTAVHSCETYCREDI